MTTSIAHLRACRAEERWRHVLSPLPDPRVSLDERHHLRQHAFAHLDTRQLERERHRARHRALSDDAPTPWQAEQLAALDAELRRRGGRWAR